MKDYEYLIAKSWSRKSMKLSPHWKISSNNSQGESFFSNTEDYLHQWKFTCE